MKITLDSILLETTRRCNIGCKLCQRGKPQYIDMSMDVLEKMFADVAHVKFVIITGGEPSLNIQLMKDFAELIKRKNLTIGSVDVRTNAKHYRSDLVSAFFDIAKLCQNRECCKIHYSIDFVNDACESAASEYRKLPFAYHTLTHNPYGELNVLLNETVIDSKFMKLNGTQNIIHVDDTIYLCANGNLLLQPHLTYELMDKHALGNVLRTPLFDIIANNICDNGTFVVIGGNPI